MDYPLPIKNLIQKFSKLPTIGPKTAERIVLFLLGQSGNELDEFSRALSAVKGSVNTCTECGNFSPTVLCAICGNSQRNKKIICVVAKPQDIIAMEKTKHYGGVYHILGGTINPLEGIHLERLNTQKLLQRLAHHQVQEVILAFNPDIEGETTILSLLQLLRATNVKITRLARGLPTGSEIEYADELTLTDALEGRKNISN